MNNKVSVVIPLYNRQHLIEETLLSIERQTLLPYEVIIVDDHSTDASFVVVGEFSKKSALNITILKNGFQKGVSGALNYGIRVASGDFIAMQDSDDLWAPMHLSNLCEALNKYPEVEIAFSSVQIFGGAKDVQKKIKDFGESVERCLHYAFENNGNSLWISNSNLLATLLTYGVPFRCQASLFRRKFFSINNIAFDEELTYTQDSQFMTMAACFSPFVYVDVVGCSIRRHAENDGDLGYREKICSNFEERCKKLRQFFSGRKMSSEEKKALELCLWRLQGYVAEQEATGRGSWHRLKASWKLFYKVPTWSSFKTAIKLLVRSRAGMSKI